MLDLKNIAMQRALTCGETEADWHKTLIACYKTFSQLNVKDSEFEKLVGLCSQNQLHMLSREFFRFKKADSMQRSPFQMLLKEVDDSEFELLQWIEAIEYIYRWLEKEKKTADLKTVLGYLNCVAQAPDNKLHQQRFVEILNGFFATYGFERAQKKPK